MFVQLFCFVLWWASLLNTGLLNLLASLVFFWQFQIPLRIPRGFSLLDLSTLHCQRREPVGYFHLDVVLLIPEFTLMWRWSLTKSLSGFLVLCFKLMAKSGYSSGFDLCTTAGGSNMESGIYLFVCLWCNLFVYARWQTEGIWSWLGSRSQSICLSMFVFF